MYRCSDCGAEHPRWGGRCDSCGAWNTLVEEPVATAQGAGGRWRATADTTGVAPIRLADVAAGGLIRWMSGLDEFDFVLGGGIVPGSLVLVGGEPGIGKSTLLLQCAARLERAGIRTIYVTGEESAEQVRLRAGRLDEDAGAVHLLPEVRLESVLGQARSHEAQVVIVDSIQTTYTEDLEGAPGNVGQVRECAGRLQRFAKETGAAVVLVGHVTRGGVIAGPKTLEHIVDTVIYFEDDVGSDFRILRAVKNRFGSVDEVGVFEMTAAGLRPVSNPSAAFLSGRDTDSAGSAVTAVLEGTRPVLVEIQALAAASGFGTPQRVATGFEHRRLAVLLAVLERRAGLTFKDLDVFLNVTGGVRLTETASDLAVAAALCSSVYDRPIAGDTLFIGEIGLGGEVRPISGLERRLAEADRLGFRRAIVSSRSRVTAPIEVSPVANVGELWSSVAS